jgi:hypothetical protein
MLSTLVVVVIVGVLVTVVLTHNTSTNTPSATGSSLTTTSTTPKSIGTEANLAAISGCEASYATIASAIQTYSTEHGANPPAGTAWALSASSGPLLQSWPSNPKYYTITWTGTSLDVTPAKGVTSRGSMGTSSPPTGCYAA